MSIVAGVDFGTQSVRVSLVDSAAGVIGFAVADLPLHRSPVDPDFATQSHDDHMQALATATRAALAAAGLDGRSVEAIALDTTGSSVIVVAEGMVPLGDYYLWCDHRAKAEAARITEVAHEEHLAAIEWCGGVYSSEWGFAKLLHWLRHNPTLRSQAVAALEHCDFVAAVLCGITDPEQLPRSICAMGHKWMWSAALGGLPSTAFLAKVDPLLADAHRLLRGRYLTSSHLAGHLTAEWAARLGLRAGIPIPVGAFDAHWDAIGAGIAEGDVVNVVGSSTCIMAIAREAQCIPGLCGVVPGSIHPDFAGIEAGLSATGTIFDAIAARAGQPVATLAGEIAGHRSGQTGLLRLTWDNGDRTVLVNPHLGGVTLGWHLGHTAADELFAAIEGTAFHTRIIVDRMASHDVPVNRIIQAGGIPQRNEVLNRVYANVLGVPVLIPERASTSLGAAIFAFLAAGTFSSVGEAQRALCSPFREVRPEPAQQATCERLFPLFRDLYFGLGRRGAQPTPIGEVLPELRLIAETVRASAPSND